MTSSSQVGSVGRGFNPVRTFIVGVGVVVALVGLFLVSEVLASVNQNEIMVIQGVGGGLTFYTNGGIHCQCFGTVTKYPKRSEYKIETQVRFNDGGHGTLFGSIQYEMPLDTKNLTSIHTQFGSPDAVKKQLVETSSVKAVYMTGPLMSSKESYAEKRNYLINYVEDQILNGVYRTKQSEVKVLDPLTGKEKTALVTDIVMNGGQPVRQEAAILGQYGIKPFNFTIEKLPYDEEVEKQIKQQQAITMQVQTAIAESRQAEQKAITVEQQGKADAAQAKWKQEVVKAQFVTEAQQQLEVATLNAKAAEQTKHKLILEGEGEAQKRQLIMSADGALDKKLAAYVETNKLYADAIKGYQGNWVPSVVMGGQGGASTAGSGAMTLMELLSIKAARDLGLDMGVGGADKTKKK